MHPVGGGGGKTTCCACTFDSVPRRQTKKATTTWEIRDFGIIVIRCYQYLVDLMVSWWQLPRFDVLYRWGTLFVHASIRAFVKCNDNSPFRRRPSFCCRMDNMDIACGFVDKFFLFLLVVCLNWFQFNPFVLYSRKKVLCKRNYGNFTWQGLIHLLYKRRWRVIYREKKQFSF